MFDHFDFLAPIYDRVIGERNRDELAQRIDLPIQGKLLDVGGGTGRISSSIYGLADEMIVLDESIGMLLQANQKNGLTTLCGVSEQLPFAENYFERVIMVDALHHVKDQRQTILELWRVLRRGGKIIIEEPDIRAMSVKFIAVMEKIFLMRSRFLSPLEISKLFPAEANILVEQEGINSWVIVDKP